MCIRRRRKNYIYIAPLGYRAHGSTCPQMFKNACCGVQDIV